MVLKILLDRREIEPDYNEQQLKDAYTDALAFVIGMHPDGRVAHWEDLVYISTENCIVTFYGPCIKPENMSEEEYYKLPHSAIIEANAKQAKMDYPEHFIAAYMYSNYHGEGTPVYINNKVN